MSKLKQLIPYVANTEPTSLEDLLFVLAKNVELAMIQAGAEPGKDYTYRDLFQMALPFALCIWKAGGDKMSFVSDHF